MKWLTVVVMILLALAVGALLGANPEDQRTLIGAGSVLGHLGSFIIWIVLMFRVHDRSRIARVWAFALLTMAFHVSSLFSWIALIGTFVKHATYVGKKAVS